MYLNCKRYLIDKLKYKYNKYAKKMLENKNTIKILRKC
jgi:hypothetical protein